VLACPDRIAAPREIGVGLGLALEELLAASLERTSAVLQPAAPSS
jgi:hypothetical protein